MYKPETVWGPFEFGRFFQAIEGPGRYLVVVPAKMIIRPLVDELSKLMTNAYEYGSFMFQRAGDTLWLERFGYEQEWQFVGKSQLHKIMGREFADAVVCCRSNQDQLSPDEFNLVSSRIRPRSQVQQMKSPSFDEPCAYCGKPAVIILSHGRKECPCGATLVSRCMTTASHSYIS